VELDRPGLLDVEGVVVEEELLDVGPEFLRVRHFRSHVIGRALPPRMSAGRLRPQAERALRWAAARRVERDERMQQEGHVVLRHVQVALVDVGHPRQRVQVFNLRPVGIVDDLAVFAIADGENLIQRLAVGILDNGVVELAAADEVDRLALVQRLVGIGRDRRSDETNLDVWVGVLDLLGPPLVAAPRNRAREENEEFVVLQDLDHLRPRDVVRVGIEQARPFEHARRVSQPNRVPVGLDFAGSGPARAGATIKVLEGRRVQK